jgi:butyrate kinase
LNVALFENDRCTQQDEIYWEVAMTCSPSEREGHIELVTQLILGILGQWGGGRVDAIASRGGFLPRPEGKLSGGVYLVAQKRDGKIVIDEDIVSAVRDRPERRHPANYGAPIAAGLALKLNTPAVIVDPVIVDEFSPEAEISGYKPIVRRNTSHALSVRAAARRAAKDIGRRLEDVNLVVAHLGGGITVAAVRRGKIIDSNISLLGGGPFTPQRAGELPVGELIDLCYSGTLTREELIDELTFHGGLRSYLGTDRMEKIEQLIAAGDKQALLVADAMTYQISKEVGKAFVATGCDVEAIVLTGGLTRSKWIRDGVKRRIIRLAPVYVYEGSLEMAALAEGAIDVLSGRQQPILYKAPEE